MASPWSANAAVEAETNAAAENESSGIDTITDAGLAILDRNDAEFLDADDRAALAAFAQEGVFYALTSARHGDHSTAFEFALDRDQRLPASQRAVRRVRGGHCRYSLPKLGFATHTTDARARPRGRVQMTKSELSIHAQFIADGIDHTDRVFRSCCERSEAMRALTTTLAASQALMAEADAMLAKGGNGLIEEYYRSKKKKAL